MTSQKISTALLGFVSAGSLSAATTAYWRLEEGADGDAVTAAADSSGNGFDQTGSAGSPVYSNDVPGAFIFDPVTSLSVANTHSLDATGANARVNTVNDVAFNTSFTVEMFIKITEEPGSFHNYLRRNGPGGTSRWQLDIDHGNMGAFGRGRVRFDTPDGDNVNYVTGPTGGAAVPESQRLWIDTDAGDGLVASYNDPTDWSNDGDGINDNQNWHHVAVTFDQDTQEVSYYFDYVLTQSRVLVDNDGSGYVHPDAQIQFGKTTNAEYGVFIDEVRYSDQVLTEGAFLVASDTVIPEPGSALLALLGAVGLVGRRRR